MFYCVDCILGVDSKLESIKLLLAYLIPLFGMKQHKSPQKSEDFCGLLELVVGIEPTTADYS